MYTVQTICATTQNGDGTPVILRAGTQYKTAEAAVLAAELIDKSYGSTYGRILHPSGSKMTTEEIKEIEEG